MDNFAALHKVWPLFSSRRRWQSSQNVDEELEACNENLRRCSFASSEHTVRVCTFALIAYTCVSIEVTYVCTYVLML